MILRQGASRSFDGGAEPRQRVFQIVIADIRQRFGHTHRRRGIEAAGGFAFAAQERRLA